MTGREDKTGVHRFRGQGKATPKRKEAFAAAKRVTGMEDSAVPVSYIPGEGGVVHTPIGDATLTREIGRGGEGAIYETSGPYVAKIFKAESLTRRRLAKLELLLNKPLSYEGICAPVYPVDNGNGERVGYLMPKAAGRELQRSLFIKPLFQRCFPEWKKRDTVQLCLTILDKIRYLHSMNIIMGDINPANILVQSPGEVYFVDVDSYQVGEYPCPVGTINYTAPEIQGRAFSTFLRSFGNEHFAVATLLFMIMLPGKPPYSQQGGGEPAENIKAMDFSYPFGEASNGKTPEGPWRYIWSNLTYEIKGAFYHTFRKGGEFAAENARLSADNWHELFSRYLTLLQSGKLTERDAMYDELFPTRFKKNENFTYITCRLCGQEMPKASCRRGYCSTCLSKAEVYECKKCGRQLSLSNFDKYIRGIKRHDYCQACFNGMRVTERRQCVDCGREFAVTAREKAFFEENGWDLPIRCPECRKRNKEAKGRGPAGGRGRGGASSHGKDSCFLTAALSGYFGKPDDCRELAMFRVFRDSWLRFQPEGPALISAYYENAPRYVRGMRSSPRHGEICEHLMTHFIQPCVRESEAGMFPACLRIYRGMMAYMENLFTTPTQNE